MAFTHQGYLPYLPLDLFQMIVRYIDPVDFVRCRRVSTVWYRAFTNPISLVQVLKSRYPLAKEVRELFQAETLQKIIHDLPHDKWRVLFDRVMERYYRLTSSGIPRSVHKFDLQQADTVESWPRLLEVGTWNTHTSHPGAKIDMLFDNAFWTYEDGLVVLPDKHERSLVVLDLETQLTFMVPFVTVDKLIRRIRLHDRLLVVEWAAQEPNGLSTYRHYATSFEINRAGRGWDVILRNEWKIFDDEHVLAPTNCFFSAHNRSHYVAYLSRFYFDPEFPVDQFLTIWDISKPSEYRASQDSTGELKDTTTDTGPPILFEYDTLMLELLDLRVTLEAGWPIEIMRMDIDSSAYTVSITRVIDVGRMDYNPLEYAPRTKVTSFPFHPSYLSPTVVRTDYHQAVYPPYRGNFSMESSPWTATSPWPCYWAIFQSADEKANVSFCLSYLSSRTQAGYDEDPLMVTIQTPHSIKTLSHDFAKEVSFKGKICGDERFLVGENAQHQLVVLYF